MRQTQKEKHALLDNKMSEIENKNTQDFPDYTSHSEKESKEKKIITLRKKILKEKITLSDNLNRFVESVKKTDFRDEPVFLVDTGEKLGLVSDMIYNDNEAVVGLKIKDDKSGAILDFPMEQIYDEKEGLILIPRWYTKAVKTIEKIEFKERVSPEITNLFKNDIISNKELYELFVEYDDEMASYMEEASFLKKILTTRLKLLENQRFAMKSHLMDLTEQRLIENIDRKQFSENVAEQRRKARIFDINIEKCKELLQRLNRTSFGVLGEDIQSVADKNNLSSVEDFNNLTEEAKVAYSDKIREKQLVQNAVAMNPLGDEITGYANKPVKNQLSSLKDINESNELSKKLGIRDAYVKDLLEELEKKNEEIKRLKNVLYKNQ